MVSQDFHPMRLTEPQKKVIGMMTKWTSKINFYIPNGKMIRFGYLALQRQDATNQEKTVGQPIKRVYGI